MPRHPHLALLTVALLAVACTSPPPLDPPRTDATAQPSPPRPPDDKGVGVPPGAAPFDPPLRARLEAAVARRDPASPPRTRHRRPDGAPTWTNRLALESSPYLLQHAHNPVNWYPWGEEAFEAARRLHRPIFLSVGYSTCHWCHVMEEESFEDLAIAELLNTRFVAIKVDREQRPDIDNLYMEAVYALRGSGGWPMTVVMTPDRQPFFGATYLPPRAGVRGSQTGLEETLLEIAERYAVAPDEVVGQAERLSRTIAQRVQPPRPGGLPGPEALTAAVDAERRSFDPINGGVGRRQKFPMPSLWSALLRIHRRAPDPATLAMVTTTLDHMANGGLNDQLGGGFHRYTVEPTWTVPHFEKMLYDNAQLVLLYLDAAQATGDLRYIEVAEQVLRYVAREMTAPVGAFYSATDADSNGAEGLFFTWTPAELRAALPPPDAALALTFWGVTDAGNFDGRTILTARPPLPTLATSLGLTEADARASLARSRDTLYATRARRVPPALDDKLLTAWNGLMISAFARAGRILGDPDHLARATTAADFVLTHLRIDGRLRHDASGDGQPSPQLGFLDDYALCIAGLLDLWEATAEPRWLSAALELQTVLDAVFADPLGGYFLESTEHEALLSRQKPADDGALPSGNAVAAHNLLRLAEITTDPAWRDRADALFKAFALVLDRSPTAMPHLLAALEASLDTPWEIVLVADSTAGHRPFLDRMAALYLPNHVLIPVVTGPQAATVEAISPLVAFKRPINGKPTAFVCQRGTCKLPTTDPDVFARQLSEVAPLP